jgi:hypothetical protein
MNMASSIETPPSVPKLNAKIEYSRVFKMQPSKTLTREGEEDFPHLTMFSRFVALLNSNIL